MRPAIVLLFLPAVALSPGACDAVPAGAPVRREMQATVMGRIPAKLICYAPDERTAGRWLEAALGALQRVDARMSAYRADSELSRLNAAPAGAWTPVSEPLMEVLVLSRRLSRDSGGRFDVTVRPLILLWKSAGANRKLPTDAELAAARAAVGFQAVELDTEGRRVRFTRPDMSIDLGAVAKGYAVDRAVDALRRAGCAAGLVEVGGDLRVFGRKPDGTKWRTGIRNPRVPAAGRPASRRSERALWTVLAVADRAVVTSGHYERSTEIEGVRYSHILDPTTGRPVRQHVASVTVVADTCALADGLATAVAVLGPVEGMALIERLAGVEAMVLVEQDPSRPLRQFASSGMASLMAR
jgi:thiamine biosynthesis lipoprotein